MIRKCALDWPHFLSPRSWRPAAPPSAGKRGGLDRRPGLASARLHPLRRVAHPVSREGPRLVRALGRHGRRADDSRRRDRRHPRGPGGLLLAPLGGCRRRPARGALRHSDWFEYAHPSGAQLFVADTATGNELNSEGEDSQGRIRFAEGSCKIGAPVSFHLEGLIDSEFGDAQPIRVTGSFSSLVGEAPPGF
jgi:hypothetical protein